MLYLEPINSACVLQCSDVCYVNDDLNTLECELLIDREKLVEVGLSQSAVSTNLEINLSATVTEIKFAFIQDQSNPLTLSLISQDSLSLRTISIDGPVTLSADQFFRPYPNLESVKLGRTVVSEFPTFRFNHKLVTLTLTGVSADSNSITAGFVSFLDTLVSIIFDCDSQIEFTSPGVFEGLTALTKLQLNRVDLSAVNPATFAPLSALKEVSLQNAKLSNLDSMPTRAQIETLNLASNSLDETKLHFSGFESLTWLRLADNSFTRLNGTLFEGTPLLEYLDLSGNQISHISNDTFEDTKLKSVILVDSQLTHLNYAVLAPLVDLTVFALDGNPLECDCGLHWVSLLHVSFQISFDVSSNSKCNSPASLSDHDVTSADNYAACNQNVTCYCDGAGSDSKCDVRYYCGTMPEPSSNPNSTTSASTESTPIAPIIPSNVAFTGIRVEVLLGILGVIFLIILFVIICLSICFCYYCCCKSDKFRLYV